MPARHKVQSPDPKSNDRMPAKARSLLKKLHGSLSLDLRHSDYPVEGEELFWATRGHCYIATEALYHLWAKDAGYIPYVLRHDNGTHWWLAHAETGVVLDPTRPQLGDEDFPYEEGHRQQFLTASPSRRTRELMRRIASDSK